MHKNERCNEYLAKSLRHIKIQDISKSSLANTPDAISFGILLNNFLFKLGKLVGKYYEIIIVEKMYIFK